MARARCVTMRCDDAVLLDGWIRYHAYQLGFDALTIVADGTSSADTSAVLCRAERAGADIRRLQAPPSDIERLAGGEGMPPHDFILALDCDEFLAVQTNDGVSCRRDRIHAALDGLRGEPRALSYAPGLARVAGSACEFTIAPIRHAFLPAGMAPHTVAATRRATPLTCIRVAGETVEDASVRVIFQGLGNLLEALGVRSERLGSPVATPRAGPDDTVWIRPAEGARPVRFEADAYRLAHEDVAASGWPPFVHYASVGMREGRRLRR